MNETAATEKRLREKLLERLYRAYLEEGLYRGVVRKKDLALELEAEGVPLERNLEYLLERGMIRMHKIEDLLSITPDGVDWIEELAHSKEDRIASLLERIEKLLGRLLERLDT